MIQNNFTVLPFYNDLKQQHSNKPYAFGAIYPLIADSETLIPFQLSVNKLASTSNILSSATLVGAKGNERKNIRAYSVDSGYISASQVVGEQVVIANSSTHSKFSIPAGSTARVSAEFGGRYGFALCDSSGEVLEFFRSDRQTSYTFRAYSFDTVLLASTDKLNSVSIENYVDVTNSLNAALIVNTGTVEDIVIYTGTATLNIDEGNYYLRLTFTTGQIVYSDVITLVDNISDYLKITWWDEKNLVFDSGKIIYNNPAYKNILYLDTDIGKPDYKFEEDGKERDGYFFAEKQLSEKVYRFTFVAPEYLCDAIRFIRLSDNVQIYKNGIDYIVDSFLADVAWQEQGDLAAVDVEFRTNTVVKKIAAAWPK